MVVFKRMLVLFAILLFGMEVSSQNILTKLVDKEWVGTGTLMKTPTTFKMVWSQELNDQFYSLNFENAREDTNGEKMIFQAKAYYKINNDSLISGTWFDSRGISFPLKAKLNNETLTVFWGSPATEEGKTVYTYTKNHAVEVEDYFLANGKYHPFGKASYIQQK